MDRKGKGRADPDVEYFQGPGDSRPDVEVLPGYKWMRDVNPNRDGLSELIEDPEEFWTNCVLSAIAVEWTLADRAAGDKTVYYQAGASEGRWSTDLERFAGQARRPATQADIEAKLLAGGTGARGMVTYTSGGRTHVVNVVNDAGEVLYLDGQAGGRIDLPADAAAVKFLPMTPNVGGLTEAQRVTLGDRRLVAVDPPAGASGVDSFIEALRMVAPDQIGEQSIGDLRARAARLLGEDLLRPPASRLFGGLLPADPVAAKSLIDTLASPGGWNADVAKVAPQLAAAMLGLNIAVIKPDGTVPPVKSIGGAGPVVHLVELTDQAGLFAATKPEPGPEPDADTDPAASIVDVLTGRKAKKKAAEPYTTTRPTRLTRTAKTKAIELISADAAGQPPPPIASASSASASRVGASSASVSRVGAASAPPPGVTISSLVVGEVEELMDEGRGRAQAKVREMLEVVLADYRALMAGWSVNIDKEAKKHKIGASDVSTKVGVLQKREKWDQVTKLLGMTQDTLLGRPQKATTPIDARKATNKEVDEVAKLLTRERTHQPKDLEGVLSAVILLNEMYHQGVKPNVAEAAKKQGFSDRRPVGLAIEPWRRSQVWPDILKALGIKNEIPVGLPTSPPIAPTSLPTTTVDSVKRILQDAVDKGRQMRSWEDDLTPVLNTIYSAYQAKKSGGRPVWPQRAAAHDLVWTVVRDSVAGWRDAQVWDDIQAALQMDIDLDIGRRVGGAISQVRDPLIPVIGTDELAEGPDRAGSSVM
jgi:hypothetical protein